MIKGSRLGYACVNQGLTNRKKKQGGRVTTSRTLRKSTWQLNEGWDYSAVGVKALDNARDLLHTPLKSEGALLLGIEPMMARYYKNSLQKNSFIFTVHKIYYLVLCSVLF